LPDVKLYAIGDLHLSHRANRRALAELPRRLGDWLVLAGDVGETTAELRLALDVLQSRFRQVVWVPGNHELWVRPKSLWGGEPSDHGEAKYRRLVGLCRERGVLTPEDPYPLWPDPNRGPYLLAPLFLLYDYSFAPDGMGPEQAVSWAAESGVRGLDEKYLWPDPHPSRVAWCHQRLALTMRRLVAERPEGVQSVLINHWPLRADLATLPRVPRFTIWCGTRHTEDWHRRHAAALVLSGHLHIPSRSFRHGTRFEEVSLGYPRQWQARGYPAISHLRQVLPAPEPATELADLPAQPLPVRDPTMGAND